MKALLIVALLLPGPAWATGPSFSCCQTKMTKLEKAFCTTNPDLSSWCIQPKERRKFKATK
jgi:hypothetical protein